MEIIHDRENQEFILELEENEYAKVFYNLDSTNKMFLIHSEVSTKYRNKGIGKKVVLKSFDKLTKEGFEAIAVCSFIKSVAINHSKWKNIIK